MTRHLDVDRIIEDWFAELPNSLPDRVVDRLVDDLDRTPQWSRFWLARRETMNRFVMAAGAVAAIALVAVIGIGLVSGGGGLFGTGATPPPTPSPSPALLARGSFLVPEDNRTELSATGEGDRVTGTLTVTDDTGSVIATDLECARTTDGGLLVIGGTVSESTTDVFAVGSRFAIILKPGSPVRAAFMFDDATIGPCPVFIAADDIDVQGAAGLRPIDGSVELAP